MARALGASCTGAARGLTRRLAAGTRWGLRALQAPGVHTPGRERRAGTCWCFDPHRSVPFLGCPGPGPARPCLPTRRPRAPAITSAGRGVTAGRRLEAWPHLCHVPQTAARSYFISDLLGAQNKGTAAVPRPTCPLHTFHPAASRAPSPFVGNARSTRRWRKKTTAGSPVPCPGRTNQFRYTSRCPQLGGHRRPVGRSPLFSPPNTSPGPLAELRAAKHLRLQQRRKGHRYRTRNLLK